jgi:transcriptional regulator with XRE-family HTH domain
VYAATRVAIPLRIATNNNMNFAEKMRDLLRLRGHTQEELADAIGTHQQTVSRWLDSPNPPKVANLLKIARYLDVSVDYLVDDTMDALKGASSLSDDERYLLRVMRGLGLDFEEIVRRLAGEVAAKPADAPSPGAGQPGSGGVVRVRDRRKQDNGDSPGVGHAEDPVPGRPDDPVPRRRGK